MQAHEGSTQTKSLRITQAIRKGGSYKPIHSSCSILSYKELQSGRGLRSPEQYHSRRHHGDVGGVQRRAHEPRGPPMRHSWAHRSRAGDGGVKGVRNGAPARYNPHAGAGLAISCRQR